ncbi:hypothetical protein NZX34_003052 [Vibrio parahaemolyticus]|uniref:hypothetical protein n=1 Tax=Vibrio parahaemolyticus TaxID=670 RepID=UPI00084AFD8C|nr:hypothetical protein [Vibrio parahaemolyticus]EGQ9827330.1 hypothetical protein [Vibrio parahaemolyticus]EHH1255707.1 hypothetical protein [Vibrio parahaemolyticus]EHR6657555.1 hypothetical protein [Vibrio parahaemolyticus]EJG2056288.1 hypothetical protein [Vibrio parahaemolyticus]EJQ9763463.1 hypothetical protein [Vibrio parahaemolyticus]
MKKTPAEVNVEKLEAWIAKQTDQDIKELNYRGSINKGAVAAQSGVNKRAITGQNQRATKIFNDWEESCRERNLLPKPTSSVSTQPKGDAHQTVEYQDPKDAEIARLNREVSRLKEQLYQQQIMMKRYDEFKDVLYSRGFYS